MKHFGNDGCNKMPKYDEPIVRFQDEPIDALKDYEFSMWHREDDEWDSMKDYEFSITNHGESPLL